METAFYQLMELAFPHVHVIFWDLDGTLGEQPGWSGRSSILSYIQNQKAFTRLLNKLRADGVYNVLVSRNGMFCGDEYDTVVGDFEKIGFNEVLSCYRTRKHSKVYGFANLNTVLLIDDQLQECLEAQADGANALHIGDIFQRAVPSGNFAILYP